MSRFSHGFKAPATAWSWKDSPELMERLEAPHPHACSSECDCGTINGHPHEPDCHWWDHCDDGKYCDKHLEQAMQEHAWMAHVGLSAVTGEMSEQDKQDIRDAGRGHLLGDWL
jgi:hypothetical protein